MNTAMYEGDYVMSKSVYLNYAKLIYNRMSVPVIHHINRLTT